MKNQNQIPNKPKKRSNQYWLKYMSMATQMILIICLGAFAGQKLDDYFGTPQAYFTAGLSLLAVGFALWYVLKDFFVGER